LEKNRQRENELDVKKDRGMKKHIWIRPFYDFENTISNKTKQMQSKRVQHSENHFISFFKNQSIVFLD
jgi:hypothetical protein